MKRVLFSMKCTGTYFFFLQSIINMLNIFQNLQKGRLTVQEEEGNNLCSGQERDREKSEAPPRGTGAL